MTYDIWIHFNGLSAKNAGLIAHRPLQERTGSEWPPVYRNLPDYKQAHFNIEVNGSNWTLDDRARIELDKQFRAKFPQEKRPLAGWSYLKDCRPKFNAKAVTC
jgi:hypothetical protein